MQKFETIVVGAGPAGLRCAKTLAEAGKEVLVLERNKAIGPKVCAGGLTLNSMRFKIPKKILGLEFKKQIIHTPFRKAVIEIKEPVITVERKELGQWMANEAKKAGAIIKTKTNVSEIKKNSVIANGEEFEFKYLVGADGSASLVRQAIGLKTEKLDIAIQYILKKKFNNLEWFCDAELFASGFAWIFPHKNYTSVGAGVDTRFLSSGKLRKNFDKWLKNMGIDVSNARFEAAPINYDYQGYEFGNKFLIDDAAGLASGLTGEGISFAMTSGHEIAKMIIDSKYSSAELKKILKIKKRQEAILKMFQSSGSLRKLEYEIIAIMLKSKPLDKKILKRFSM